MYLASNQRVRAETGPSPSGERTTVSGFGSSLAGAPFGTGAAPVATLNRVADHPLARGDGHAR